MLKFCRNCNKHKKESKTKGENVRVYYYPSKYVFLATAQLTAKDKHLNEVSCRILLDSGSQINLITTKLAQKLNVQSRSLPVSITGIGRMTKSATKCITVYLESKQTNYTFKIDAIILKEITTNQPLIFVNTKRWPIPKKIKLADPSFYRPQQVDMLIGAEVYPHLMLSDRIAMSDRLPILQNTKVGWVVLGKLIARPEDFMRTSIRNRERADSIGASAMVEKKTS